MDAEAVTTRGIAAIQAELDTIAAISDMDGVYRTFSELEIYDVNAPVGFGILSDMKDPDVNAIYYDSYVVVACMLCCF